MWNWFPGPNPPTPRCEVCGEEILDAAWGLCGACQFVFGLNYAEEYHILAQIAEQCKERQ